MMRIQLPAQGEGIAGVSWSLIAPCPECNARVRVERKHLVTHDAEGEGKRCRGTHRYVSFERLTTDARKAELLAKQVTQSDGRAPFSERMRWLPFAAANITTAVLPGPLAKIWRAASELLNANDLRFYSEENEVHDSFVRFWAATDEAIFACLKLRAGLSDSPGGDGIGKLYAAIPSPIRNTLTRRIRIDPESPMRGGYMRKRNRDLEEREATVRVFNWKDVEVVSIRGPNAGTVYPHGYDVSDAYLSVREIQDCHDNKDGRHKRLVKAIRAVCRRKSKHERRLDGLPPRRSGAWLWRETKRAREARAYKWAWIDGVVTNESDFRDAKDRVKNKTPDARTRKTASKPGVNSPSNDRVDPVKGYSPLRGELEDQMSAADRGAPSFGGESQIRDSDVTRSIDAAGSSESAGKRRASLVPSAQGPPGASSRPNDSHDRTPQQARFGTETDPLWAKYRKEDQ